MVVLLAVAAAAGAAVALALAGGTETMTVTTTVTRTETVEAESPLVPAEVERTRAAVRAAAEAHDYDALAELIDPAQFSFSFGDPGGGAVEYWRDLAAQGEDPLPILARILELPYTLFAGAYVWPFAYDKAPNELSDYERGLLGDLVESYAGESYFGWRAGIRADGKWQFFVRGD